MDLRIEAPDSARYQAALRHTSRGARRAIRLAGAALLCLSLISLLDSALTSSATLALRLAFLVLGLACFALGGVRQFISVPTTSLADGQLTELRRFAADRDARGSGG